MSTSILESGLPSVDYYAAPNYQIEVEGAELDAATKGDVLQLKVTMEKQGLTSFSLTVNNWDDQTLQFKYSDENTFFIGRRIQIKMGYADKLVSMVRGQITSMSPKFPASGSPTMEVSGTDRLFLLKDSKPNDGDTLSYTRKADWQIARAVAARNKLPIEVTREGPVHELVVQSKDQDDARFLLDRAGRVEFDVFMQTDPKSGTDKLFFVKPTDGRDGRSIRVYSFEFGSSLISFTPRLKVSDQVSAVTVRGWDARTKKPIVAKATAADLPRTEGGGKNGPSAAKSTAARSSGKQEFIVDSSVISKEEAKALAVSRLIENAYQYNTGSGEVIGLPDLRPGDNVELSGLGKRFSGQYQVDKVEHSLGSSGYLTQFDVKKLKDGGA